MNHRQEELTESQKDRLLPNLKYHIQYINMLAVSPYSFCTATYLNCILLQTALMKYFTKIHNSNGTKAQQYTRNNQYYVVPEIRRKQL